MSNNHDLATVISEQGAWWMDAVIGYVVKGFEFAVPSSSLTLNPTGGAAYVMDLSKDQAIYVAQNAVTISIDDATPTWLILHRDTVTAITDWTRRAGSYYLYRQSAEMPTIPDGAILLAQITVAGSVITEIADWRNTTLIHDFQARPPGANPGYVLDFREQGVRFPALNGEGATIDDVVQAAPSVVPYAGIIGIKDDIGDEINPTRGSLWFYTNDAGFYVPQAHIDDTGTLIVSPNSGTEQPAGGIQTRMEVRAGDGVDERLITLVNDLETPLVGTSGRIQFLTRDSSGGSPPTYIQIGHLQVSLTDPTLGAEQSRVIFNGLSPDVGNRSILDLLATKTGGQLSRVKYVVEAHTTDKAIDGSDSIDAFKIFANIGATGPVTFTLPACSDVGLGYSVGFVSGAEQPLIVKPQAADRLGQGVTHGEGLAWETSGASSYLRLVCTSDAVSGTWSIQEQYGPWAGGIMPDDGLMQGVGLYDFATGGGAIDNHEMSRLPVNAVITRSFYQVIFPFASGGSANIGMGIASDDVDGIVVPTLFGTGPWTPGFHDGIQTGLSTNFTTITTASRNIILTVSGATVTAGKVKLWYEYLVTE